MANWKKLAMGAAGAAGGSPLNVEDVFSIDLYAGTGASQSITNGIDLNTNGGLVWTRRRDNSGSGSSTYTSYIFDTERGTGKSLFFTYSNAAELSYTNTLTAFNTDGFSVGVNSNVNYNGDSYGAWTFRKAPKFFDIVTYTGDGSYPREISHNLGSVPGCIIIKSRTETRDWVMYHRGLDSTNPAGFHLIMNTNDGAADSLGPFRDIEPTSTEFTVGGSVHVNRLDQDYVAYIFAHHDGDGEFGPDGNEDIISCGSYTGSGYPNTTDLNIGFEPQFILIKKYSAFQDWKIFDTTRGMGDGPEQSTTGILEIEPNYSYSESGFSGDRIKIRSNTFKVYNNSEINTSGDDYIYIAVKMGNKAQASATDVFAPVNYNASNSPRYLSGFKPDMAFYRQINTTDDTDITSRVTGRAGLLTNDNRIATTSSITWDHINGLQTGLPFTSNGYAWMWKRARGFFDVVLYDGEGSGSNTNMKDHNLGAKPDMIWVKRRTTSASDWVVWHKDMDSSSLNDYTNRWTLRLNNNNAATNNNGYWAWPGTGYTADMNETQFSVGSSGMDWTNNTNSVYLAYLFASQDGISKVGYYTGTGSDQTIDCGFSSGARFVLIKRVDAAGNWYYWDTVRGIVSSADDPGLRLDTNNAVANANNIEPHNSGFIIRQNTANANVSSGHYIFYAIP